MIVHNVYSDILFFVSHVLNSILSNRIQEFKYNLGNASFALSYNPNYKLPNALINFIAVNPFNTRMNTFHKVLTNNTYLIPVLYDRNKDLKLELQEDLYYVDISVNINTESQLHAIELKHNLENFLPVGKLLNYLSFCSFFEIDKVFLNKYLFDVESDDIDNLFLVHNKLTDTMVYCFSTEYTPLIRLESIDLSITDISAATFTVSTNFKILTHLPSKLIFNKPLLKDYTSVHLLKHDNIKVPINNNYEYYLLNNERLINDSDVNYSITKSEKFTKIGEFHSVFNNNHINGRIIIENNVIRINTFDNEYSGIVKNSEFLENNKIKGIFNSEEIFIVYSIHKVKQNVSIKSLNEDYKIKIYDIIVPNEIYSIVKNINQYKTEINYEETEILGFNEFVLNTPVKLNSNGNFEFNYENTYIIKGSIDLKTGKIEIINLLNFDLSNNNTIILDTLNLNLVFTVFEIRGSGYIEHIVLDVNSTFNNSISTVSVINNENITYNKNIKNILVDKIEFIENDNHRIKFAIFNNIELNNIDYSFYFTKSNRVINSNTNFIIYKEFSNNKLIFTTSEKFYYDNFSEINNMYPLILKIGL